MRRLEPGERGQRAGKLVLLRRGHRRGIETEDRVTREVATNFRAELKVLAHVDPQPSWWSSATEVAGGALT